MGVNANTLDRDGSADDGKRFHFSETLGVPFDELGSLGSGGSGGRGGAADHGPGRRII